MVCDDETVGLIAMSKPKTQTNATKAVLRLVSQLGAVAVRNVLVYKQLKRTADIDGLTGLYCKGYMLVPLGELIFEAQHRSSPLSVFFFVIDNFKGYSDVNGHSAGDRLTQLLARLVEENIRWNAVLGRFGGEKFLIIFPEMDKSQALKAARTICAKVSNHEFPFAERQPLGVVSISGGVASYPEDSLDSAGLLRRADSALYRANAEGRNRVLAADLQYLGEEAIEPNLGLPDALVDRS